MIPDEHTTAEAEAKPVITITRSKLYPTPGRSYRFAWKWYYQIEGSIAPDGDFWSGQTVRKELESALKRRFPDHRIVRDWEVGDARP